MAQSLWVHRSGSTPARRLLNNRGLHLPQHRRLAAFLSRRQKWRPHFQIRTRGSKTSFGVRQWKYKPRRHSTCRQEAWSHRAMRQDNCNLHLGRTSDATYFPRRWRCKSRRNLRPRQRLVFSRLVIRCFCIFSGRRIMCAPHPYRLLHTISQNRLYRDQLEVRPPLVVTQMPRLRLAWGARARFS